MAQWFISMWSDSTALERTTASRAFPVDCRSRPPRPRGRLRRFVGKVIGVLGHAAPTDPLVVPASPALRRQLSREAADHGMSLAQWAVMKLESDALRSPASPPAYMPVVDRWRTRC